MPLSPGGTPADEDADPLSDVIMEQMPKPLLNRIHSEFMKALNSPKMQEAIFNQGATGVGNSPEEFRKYLLADMEKWQKVVKASGAKAF